MTSQIITVMIITETFLTWKIYYFDRLTSIFLSKINTQSHHDPYSIRNDLQITE